MNKFEGCEKMITAADIDNVEKKLGIRFPVEYREHYLKHNGGSPKKCLFESGESVHVVSEFLPIKHGNDTLEEKAIEVRTHETYIPNHMIPFAYDPGGDYFCFSTRESDEGAISLFFHDYYDNPKRSTRKLAASLGEFLKGLKDEE